MTQPTEVLVTGDATIAIEPPTNGNGNQPTEATIDEQSKQTAVARAMIENEKRAREQRCGMEIDNALTAILKRHHCAAKFCELREGGQSVRIWLQPVALDEA